MQASLTTRQLLAIAALFTVGCPVDVPVVRSLAFACHSDADCAVGHSCVDEICTPLGSDAGLAPNDANHDTGRGDVIAADTGAGDAAAADTAAADSSAADRVPVDRSVADVPVTDGLRSDTISVDRAAPDTAASDTAAPDIAASDTAAPDTVARDTAAPDTAAPDTAAPDITASDITASDITASDTAAPDTAAPDTAASDRATPDTSGDDAGRAWWDPGFGQRVKLTFDNRAAGEDLIDFPVWVRLTDADLDLSAVHDNGADLRFIDADGSGPLAHELARLDADQLEVWVKVPRIDAGSSADHIWLYFDDATTSSVEAPAAVWSAGYAGVWHLDHVPVGQGAVLDSLGQHHGTSQGSMTSGDLVDGQLTGAIEFDGSDDAIDLGDLGSNGWGGLTLEAWAFAESIPDDPRFVCKSPSTNSSDHVYCLLHQGDFVRARMVTDGSGGGATGNVLSESVISLNSWVYAVMTWSAASARVEIYLDGVNRGGVNRDGDSLDDSSQETFIGNVNATQSRWFDGPIDEVRISSVARSADWVRAQHLSMTGLFVTAAAGEARP